MKLSGSAVDKFLQAPGAGFRAVLFYGPDSGLVRERAQRAVVAVAGEGNDPFRVGELSGRVVREEPARLFDEAGAMALTGGRRVVCLRDAGDANSGALSSVMADGAGDSLVVVEAGDLGPRSSLRRLFENAENGACIPCYGDSGKDLATVIKETLGASDVSVESDAAEFLALNLGNDRMVSRRELEKLALYVGSGNVATVADAMACVGDNSAMAVDDIVDAVALGNPGEAGRLLERCREEGVNEIQVLRAAQRHFQRLESAAIAVAAGQSADSVVRGLRPPLFFRRADNFRRQLGLWRPAASADQTDELLSAEAACKTTGAPMAEILGRVLLRAAARARRAGTAQVVHRG